MDLTNKPIKRMENGKFLINVYLDFSKAFDTIELSNHKQYVTYNMVSVYNILSATGIYRGTIIISVTHKRSWENIFFFNFADDTNLFERFESGSNLSHKQDELNHALLKISTWLSHFLLILVNHILKSFAGWPPRTILKCHFHPYFNAAGLKTWFFLLFYLEFDHLKTDLTRCETVPFS